MMEIALYQTSIKPKDKHSNLNKVRELLAANHDFDILALPEMFSTGYTSHPSQLAESDSGETIETIASLAEEHGVAICGSFIAEDNGKYHNRSFFITPEGGRYFCNKRHLFILGGESDAYGQGFERLTVEYKGYRIALFICFDLRFPVWSRNMAGEAYDVAIYVANWPKARIREWDTLLMARAIENQAYVCGVNICGAMPNGLDYTGHSAAYDYRGRSLTEIREHECLLIAKLEKDKLIEYRKSFPVLLSQDCFTLNK